MNIQAVSGVRRTIYAMMVITVLVAVSALKCGGGLDNGGSGSGDSGSIAVTVVSDAPGTAQYCTSHSIYTYNPGQLTGTSGSASRVVHEKDETVFASNGECRFGDSVFDVRTGQWTVIPSFARGCSVSVHPGTNAVTINKDGSCSSY